MCDYIVDCMKEGDLDALERIITSMSNINDVVLSDEENSLNLLHLAAGISCDHRDKILEFYLELGADANCPGKQDRVSGVRALHIAASWGYDVSVKILLLYQADASLRDSDGYSPIDYASVYDNYTCISILLKYGCLNTSSDTSDWSHVFETSAGDSSTASFQFVARGERNPRKLGDVFTDRHTTSLQFVKRESEDTNDETLREFCAGDSHTATFYYSINDETNLEKSDDNCAGDSSVASFQLVNRESVERNLEKLGDNYAQFLRTELKKFGRIAGPITSTTKGVYTKLLLSLQRTQNLTELPPLSILDQKLGYSSELRSLLSGRFPFSDAQDLEREFIATSDSDTLNGPKQFFNYLLLDPRISNNLCDQTALNGTPLNELLFMQFIKAIFYIGKGQKKRDFAHLYDALADRDAITKAKIDQIRSIWSDGYGVVSLHIFNNISGKEALTREALMIEAIGLDNLTNVVKGTIKIRMTWNDHKRKLLGTLLLWKAFSIYLNEGERQLRREDLNARFER